MHYLTFITRLGALIRVDAWFSVCGQLRGASQKDGELSDTEAKAHLRLPSNMCALRWQAVINRVFVGCSRMFQCCNTCFLHGFVVILTVLPY